MATKTVKPEAVEQTANEVLAESEFAALFVSPLELELVTLLRMGAWVIEVQGRVEEIKSQEFPEAALLDLLADMVQRLLSFGAIVDEAKFGAAFRGKNSGKLSEALFMYAAAVGESISSDE